MLIPSHLKYTASHEWIEMISETSARVGITDYAQSHMGDIVFVNLPSVGNKVAVGEAMNDIESVKAVEDIICPATGTIAEVNDQLDGAPELLNQAPYEAWIAVIADITATEELLDAEAYLKLIGEEA